MIPKSIIILGSNGFIGSRLSKMLFMNPGLREVVYSIPKKYDYNDAYIDNLRLENIYSKKLISFSKISDEVIVVNCAAERHSELDNKVKAGNYDFQLIILKKLLSEGKNVSWIQLETYWQNSLEVCPSPRYVYWKNEFRLKLTEIASLQKLKTQFIVLPHVIGVDDDDNRYLNKIFRSIILGEKIVLRNENNSFYLCDVEDLCNYLISLILGSELDVDNQSSLFPFHTIKLATLISQFKQLAKSDSIIDFEFDKSYTNPIMRIELQPMLISSKRVVLTRLELSLAKILGWMNKV